MSIGVAVANSTSASIIEASLSMPHVHIVVVQQSHSTVSLCSSVQGRVRGGGGGVRGLEHPPKPCNVWHNSQLSSCVTTNKQQLVANTNIELTGLALNGSFSSLLGLKQPSLSSSCLQECVNEGRGQRFGGMAKSFACALCVRLVQHLLSSNPGHAPGV